MNPANLSKEKNMAFKKKRMKVRIQSFTKMSTKMSPCIGRTKSNHLLCRKARNLLYQDAKMKVKKKSKQMNKKIS